LRQEKDGAKRDADRLFAKLESLKDRFVTENVTQEFEEKYSAAETLDDGTLDGLKKSIASYRSINVELGNLLSNPVAKMKVVLHDPLDDSVLTDPVELEIEHPQKGKITLQVNSWNKDKYLAHGPKAFRKPKGERPNYAYQMGGVSPGEQAGGTTEIHYYHDRGGLDIWDYMILDSMMHRHDERGHEPEHRTEQFQQRESGTGGGFGHRPESEPRLEEPHFGGSKEFDGGGATVDAREAAREQAMSSIAEDHSEHASSGGSSDHS
jgi:hypothetical protein